MLRKKRLLRFLPRNTYRDTHGAITISGGREGSEDPNLVLARHGLKYHEGMLAVANDNSNLQSILRDTPWSGNAFITSLRRLKDSRLSGPIRYPAMGTSRGTLVSLEGLI